MPHSYEELRAAAFDVLSERYKSSWGVNQYLNFQNSLAEALEARAPNTQPKNSVYQNRATLDAADAETFLELFWNLFRQGVITLGSNSSNPNFPFCRVTELGKRLAEGENGYFVHDVSGYENRIRLEIPKINEDTLLYLKEALQAFRSDCILSATVMLGVATEHTFLILIEAITGNPKHQPTFSAVDKERGVLRKLNKFRKILDQETKNLPGPIKEDLDTYFASILTIIRNYRNESGHPSGKIISREQAFVLLQIFPQYCKKMYQLIEHYSL